MPRIIRPRRHSAPSSRTQPALLASEARLASIVSIADDAILTADASQRITLFNKGAERIFGYGAQEIIGRPLSVLIPDRFAARHRRQLVHFGASGDAARTMGERREIRGLRKDGTEFPAEASISALHVGGETVYSVILRDVTGRKQIEQQLERMVHQRTLQLSAMLILVSHEMRNKLSVIRGAASLLLRKNDEPTPKLRAHWLATIAKAVDQSVELIEETLQSAGLEEEEWEVVKDRGSRVWQARFPQPPADTGPTGETEPGAGSTDTAP